jgi:hypothetical protein
MGSYISLYLNVRGKLVRNCIDSGVEPGKKKGKIRGWALCPWYVRVNLRRGRQPSKDPKNDMRAYQKGAELNEENRRDFGK